MNYRTLGRVSRGWWVLGAFLLATSASAQESPAYAPMHYNADETALVLARRYLEGGDGGRAAVLEALQRMGWSVRNAQGTVLKAPAAAADTGLALRDYELEELLWKPSEQPVVRFISVAQALAVPFEDSDPEQLAQDLLDTIRRSAESTQPQQRFWARFIVALGRVSPANYDLMAPAPASVIPPDPARLKKAEQGPKDNILAGLSAMEPTPVWPANDPVLAPSPRPKRSPGQADVDPAERDRKRMQELSDELGKLSGESDAQDEAHYQAAQEKMAKLTVELATIGQRQSAAGLQQMGAAMRQMQNVQGETAPDTGPRFLAEWRDQPLSLLQIALITRVLAADVRRAAARDPALPGHAGGWSGRGFLPLAMITLAQVAGPAPSFREQFSGAAGDIWATGWGAYTGAVLDHHMPENKFSKATAIANTLIAWFKTIMTVVRQKITIEVEKTPLLRTKTRSPGEQLTARAKVVIDFPKSEMLKVLRAAGNLATIDLQLPEGGPVSGARVVWRLPEGSYNAKYQAANGSSVFKPEFAVVQFAAVGSTAAYISSTNDAGEATITIEGVPQRSTLSTTVRPYPRRAVIAVEVTIKVGNLTQDMNDIISNLLGGPVNGTLTFLADMVLRTSFFFQKGQAFEVTDWKEPAWEGEFVIKVNGSGSKHVKGEKGGPDSEIAWKMDRHMEGRLHTPDWEEGTEDQKKYANDGRHHLDVDGDSRMFRLEDSSSSKSRNNDNNYLASGPLQIQPPGQNQLELLSRSEPSGSADLVFNGGFMTLELKPYFGAECLVGRSEEGRGRSFSKAGPEYLNLLGGVNPDTFTIIEPNDGSGDSIDGSKTFDGRGSLPYVPGFDVTVTVTYHLRKNVPPPKSKR